MSLAASSAVPRAGFLASVANVLLAPASAFAALRGRRGWGRKSLLLIVLAQSLAVALFVAPLDHDWLVAQQLQQMGELSTGEREPVQAQLLAMAPHYPTLAVAGTALSMVLLVLLLAGAYWLLAAIAAPRRVAFADWLRFAVWTQWPCLLQAVVIAVLALVAGPQRPLALVNFASLNELWLHWPADHRGYVWALSLNLFTLWGALLAIPGWRGWTGVGPGRAALLALLPYLLVFGAWAGLAWS